METFRILACFGALVCSSFGQGVNPAKGFVPDAKTATRIAEAVLSAVYGEDVTSERPFTAKLEHGAWTVTGTLHCQENLPGPPYCHGGHSVRISKHDGRILFMWPGNGSPL